MARVEHSPCDILAQALSRLFVCSSQGEYTKIVTPYLYPDGDSIYLYAKPNTNRIGGTVSDMGETVRWLKGQTLSPKRSPRQNTMLSDICATLGVEFFKGSLLVRYENEEQFTGASTRVAQAAIRVSDLWLSFRNRAVESVTEEVEEYIAQEHIPFEKTPALPGRSGRIWTPHFMTHTEARTSLIYVLATGSKSAAKGVAEHVLAAWFDLANLKFGQRPTEFVSLFDDTADVWGEHDFSLVGQLSKVTRWSEPEDLARILKAA